MASYESGVYISYAWGKQGEEKEEIVNQLDRALQERGIKIIRDKRDLGYRGSITKFMEQIGRGVCVIVVVSDKYLRSPNCMFELVEIAENKQFHERIFPIVLADADIYDPVKRLDYVSFWEAKRAELAEKMKKVDPANLQGLREDIDNYDRFRDKISGLTSILKDMNTLTPDMHRDSDFEALYAAIQTRLSQIEPKGGAMSTSESADNKEPEKNTDDSNKGTTNLHIGGNVNGPVQTNPVFQGPVHFGDQIQSQEVVHGTSVKIGGDVSGSNIVVGNNNNVSLTQGASAEEIAKAFSTLMQAVQTKPDDPMKTVAETAVKGLEAEAAKGEDADEGKVGQWFTTLAKMAPDILEVAIDTFTNPIKGLSTVFKKVAERAKAERNKG